MGHYCRICGRSKSNESFSGKGHRTHVCKKCARLPKEERDAAEQMDEIYEFLRQGRISEKNLARLQFLARSPDAITAQHARIAWHVAIVKPRRKHRMKFLFRHWPGLFDLLAESALIDAHMDEMCNGGVEDSGFFLNELQRMDPELYDEFQDNGVFEQQATPEDIWELQWWD